MAQPLTPPIGPGVPTRPTYRPVDPYVGHDVLRYLGSMPTSDEWRNLMTSRVAPGTMAGGADVRQLFDALNPEGFTANGPRPNLTDPLLLHMGAPSLDHLGNLQIDFLNPSGVYEGLMRASGIMAEDATQLPGGFDPGAFLAQKHIDLFGMGVTGAPARLADYANPASWVPTMLLRRMLGDRSYELTPEQQAQINQRTESFFAFQTDPRYWTYLSQVTLTNPGNDQLIRDLAHAVAVDSVGEAYVANVEQLLTVQMLKDRDEAVFLTSGDERTDWVAKAGLQVDLAAAAPAPVQTPENLGPIESFLAFLGRTAPTDPLAPAPFIPAPNPLVAGSTEFSREYSGVVLGTVPFLGADMQQAAYPISAETEQAWANLTPEQRRRYIESAGIANTAVDTATLLIGFGGLSVVRGMAIAGRFGKAGEAAATAYDVVLKLANVTMATGLINATTNWALEAMNKQYEQDIGRWIDLSRPVSQSNLAGFVNGIGYLGSGTYGAAQAAKFLRRGIGIGLDVAERMPALGRYVPRPIFGVKEIQYHRAIYGGGQAVADVERMAEGAAFSRLGSETAVRASFLSSLTNYVRDLSLGHVVADYEAAQRPGAKSVLANLFHSDPAAFHAAYERDLLRAAEATPYTQTGIMRSLAALHEDLSVFALDRAEQVHNAAKRVAKAIDDGATRYQLDRYGTRFMHLTTPEQLQAEARKLIAEGSGKVRDEAALLRMGRGVRGMEYGRKQLQLMYQDAYHYKMAKLLEVAKGSKEASTVSLGSLENLFGDEIETVVAALRGQEIDASLLARIRHPLDPTELMAWVKARQDVPRTFRAIEKPESLANRLEEVADMFPPRRVVDPNVVDSGLLNDFQLGLEAEGRWTVIEKPRRKPFAPPTEAGPLEQGITGAERSASDFASIRRLGGDPTDPTTGTIFKSPWIEYPMGSLDQIELGNRGVLASMFDSTTMGVRAWRISEWQRTNLHRLLTTRYSLPEWQINEMHRAMQTMSANPLQAGEVFGKRFWSETRVMGQGIDKAHLSLQGWAWTNQARLHAERIFTPGGEKLLNRVTGQLEVPDWNKLLAKAYTQSIRLNALAGITSYLKAMPGLGPNIIFLSETLYTKWRFGLSPLFKLGEYAESAMFNLGRGVYWEDPVSAGLILRAVGRREGAHFQSEVDVGANELTGIGSATTEGSRREADAEVGSYIMAGREGALNAARQTRMARLAGEASPDDLKGALGLSPRERAGRQMYPQTIPDEDIAQVVDGEVVYPRNGRETMRQLIDDQATALYSRLTPQQMAQVNRVNTYLRPLAEMHSPLHLQPLRQRATARVVRNAPTVAIKPEAVTKYYAPYYSGERRFPARNQSRYTYDPLTPEGLVRMRQLGLQKAAAGADPNHTLFDVALGHVNGLGEDVVLNNPVPGTWVDVDWSDVDAVFLGSGPGWQNERRAWKQFLDRLPENHPAREVEVRYYEPGLVRDPLSGDVIGGTLQRAYTQYWLERAGVADLASRSIASMGHLEPAAERVARNITNFVDVPEFRSALREAATAKIGYDPGEPMIRAYLRFNPATQHDQLVLVAQAGNGRSLGLAPHEMADLWEQFGLPRNFAGSLGEDPIAYLRNQGMDAIAFEHVPGFAGRLHVYANPNRGQIKAVINTDAAGLRSWSDPSHRAIDINFASRFDASYDYQPLTDFYPRFDVGQTFHDKPAGTVTYSPSAPARRWSYQYDETPNYVDVTLSDDLLHGYQREEQLRDVFFRFRGKPIRIYLPDEAAADAMGRLWIRGELPAEVIPTYNKIIPTSAWLGHTEAEQRAFAKSLHDEQGLWLHGSARPETRPAEGSTRPYYTTSDLYTAELYSGFNPDNIYVAAAPKNAVRMWRKPGDPVPPGRTEFLDAYQRYLYDLDDDLGELERGVAGLDPDVARARFLDKHPEFSGIKYRVYKHDPAKFDAWFVSIGEAYAIDDATSIIHHMDDEIYGHMEDLGLEWANTQPVAQLGAQPPTIHVAKSLGFDAIEYDYGPPRVGGAVRQAGAPIDSNLVTVYLEGRPAVRNIREDWARAHPATSEVLPFDLATMRTRMNVPEDIANSVPRATGDMADLAYTDMAILDEAERQLETMAAAPPSRRPTEGWVDRVIRWANPVPWKLEQEAKLKAFLQRNTFADLLQQANPRLYQFYTRELQVPRVALTRFKVEDKMLYDQWVRTQSRADFDAFVAHADKYTGGVQSAEKLRALYESEGWAALSDLWLLNAEAVSQEAFTTHFFSSYRSALERSLNHPVLGIFPLSWSYKAGREWALFMFNNRALGLRLGMTPAVAIKYLQREQEKQWAKDPENTDSFGHLISSKRGSKFSALFFMANLILPGDWSGIPFPLAWPVRAVLRGQPQNVLDFNQYWDNWGISRDWRLAREGLDEISKALTGPPPLAPASSRRAVVSQTRYEEEQHASNPR